MKLVISLVCGPESAHELSLAEDFHRGEQKTDSLSDLARALLLPLS